MPKALNINMFAFKEFQDNENSKIMRNIVLVQSNTYVAILLESFKRTFQSFVLHIMIIELIIFKISIQETYTVRINEIAAFLVLNLNFWDLFK